MTRYTGERQLQMSKVNEQRKQELSNEQNKMIATLILQNGET